MSTKKQPLTDTKFNKYFSIGNRITRIRENCGLSQRKFADSIGISQSFLSELELGITRPSIPILLAIEYIYGFRKEWVATGDEPIYKTEFDRPTLFSADGLEMSQKQLNVWLFRLIKVFRSGNKDKINLIKAQLRLFDSETETQGGKQDPLKRQ